MTEMLAEALAGAFDLLLAGYSDRWQRNLRQTLELLEDGLHPAGVALVMCDRRILSSDPRDWDELISEAAGAEKYSRRLSERITDGYAAKFDHRDDPGGHAGLGFRRLPEPPHTLEVDPETIGVAVGLFERYALGNVSAAQLEDETGLAASRIRMILMNPLYNGWIVRHRRSDRESRKPAPWRANPPVSDELLARVEDVRRGKTRGGGAKRHDRIDLLGGLLECGLASPTPFGRGRCLRRSPASRSTTTRSPRWSRSSDRPGGRSRWTGPGSTGGSASSPSSTRLATSPTTPTLPGSRRCGRPATRSPRGPGSGSRHSAPSNGSRRSPSQSSRQTYRRRGQT
ncbi:MAG: hypothetical protein HYX57_05970 [Chloroflexi bacterium]|nr:hypothetical protein [Chloroflexota bacterium]